MPVMVIGTIVIFGRLFGRPRGRAAGLGLPLFDRKTPLVITVIFPHSTLLSRLSREWQLWLGEKYTLHSSNLFLQGTPVIYFLARQ
jgi:hypothetical protein